MNARPAPLALAVAALLAAPAARAQSAGRFSARVEAGASLLVSSPQSRDFGLGFAARGDVGVRVAGPLHLRAFGAYLRWPASSSQSGDGASAATALLGGGLSVEPELTRRVRLRFEGDLAVSLNGASSDARLAWGGGVGAWFGLGDRVDLGPMVRVGAIQPAASEDTSNGGPGAAHYLQFAVALAFHDAAPAPAVVEPAPAFVAAPPPAPAPVVVVAPPPAAPLVTFGAPAASPSGAVVGPSQAFVPGAPVPAVIQEEEPRGRHHGRHRRDRGSHRGHREGGSRHHRRRH
ncbi:MAG: hypothetical protein U0324_06505 [Polyangiales bacterium]